MFLVRSQVKGLLPSRQRGVQEHPPVAQSVHFENLPCRRFVFWEICTSQGGWNLGALYFFGPHKNIVLKLIIPEESDYV